MNTTMHLAPDHLLNDSDQAPLLSALKRRGHRNDGALSVPKETLKRDISRANTSCIFQLHVQIITDTEEGQEEDMGAPIHTYIHTHLPYTAYQVSFSWLGFREKSIEYKHTTHTAAKPGRQADRQEADKSQTCIHSFNHPPHHVSKAPSHAKRDTCLGRQTTKTAPVAAAVTFRQEQQQTEQASSQPPWPDHIKPV
ncbi:hypothetical protein VOLCADRAFT_107035 [Volvox carteri f. nagariensis]|uniref:Uncharacterized protein n=1 Tax=Volvox carteri f. nagariensis TaxID=3068 RepID=D8UBF6_VOLCA|nr:uncharacterized protein VOLCADRAFT_107035 [Volvox carteri f. nagariensis]EFJ42995.1 hypothetical protein VOLCADRAFT_107035 [Volvox carteri f. nagariensis]|eukprot:XP_002956035.1 hypothetical protein VOLCADRAFT_107035 [Volvox carteri f. nagariensis]